MSFKESLKAKALQLKTDLPALFLAIGKRETPILAKLFAGLILCYALSPIDLIPDFIPVLGFLDDVLLLPALIVLLLRMMPLSVMEQCRQEADGLWREGVPKRWYFAIPVLVLWALFFWWFWGLFF